MKFLQFKVIYCPFTTSDITAEQFVWATDEQDARTVFQNQHRFEQFSVKEIIPV